MKTSSYKYVFLVIQIATIAVFLGRGLQHLLWDAPYRSLLWDQSLMEGVISSLFNLSWDDYVSNTSISNGIDTFTRFMGGFYILCALSALLIKKLPGISRVILLVGGIGLIFLAGLYYKEKFMAIGQFWEYTLQWSSPFFLLAIHKKQEITERIIRLLKVATVLTFTCHGLYALGYYPRPGSFLEMTINILGVSDTQAITFLNIAGVMDFVIAFLIFFPRKIAIVALIYTCFWGFMTTIARVWAYFHWEFWQESLLQWLPESIFRFPHFLLPLALLIYYRNSEN